MGEKQTASTSLLATVGAVIMIVAVAAVFITSYTFDGPSISDTWPGLLVAVGVVLALARYYGLALGVVGFFGVLLAANLVPFSFRRAWPLTLIVVAVAVVIEFLRARAGHSPGPQSEARK
jgi:hypothetical protein